MAYIYGSKWSKPEKKQISAFQISITMCQFSETECTCCCQNDFHVVKKRIRLLQVPIVLFGSFGFFQSSILLDFLSDV